MHRIVGIGMGIGCIVFGIVIYPYYVTYFIGPIQTLIVQMYPAMNAWENAFIDSLPLIILLIIIFCAGMHFLGKVGGSNDGIE